MRHLALCLALAAAAPLASAGCLPVIGTVILTPELPGTCTVQAMQVGGQWPGLNFLGNYDPSNPVCFTSKLKLVGLPAINGHSGVTSELMGSLLPGGGAAASPAGVQDNRAILTARSTFALGGTRFYAAEVIIDTGHGQMVTEQSVITSTDGKGLFKNATGGFTILGNSIGETARVQGQLCTK